MAILVWVTLGIALWHFTVFVPDRFRGGIVGAFLAAVVGACVTGALWQIATGDSLGQTDVLTALAAVPGTVIAAGIVYMLGVRDEEARDLPY
jgi:ABC-type Fe3+ transport system permease subunit